MRESLSLSLCEREREGERESERERGRGREREREGEGKRVSDSRSVPRLSYTTQGPSWGYLKSQFSIDRVNFGDKCPQNGSKTAPTAPRPHLGYPHIGPFVEPGRSAVKRIWHIYDSQRQTMDLSFR